MERVSEGKLLRIFIGEDDEFEGRPLYSAIVERLLEEGAAGATVFRGIMGYGAATRIHTAKVLRLSENLPIVIECVDEAGNIDRVLPRLGEMITHGLVTVERAEVHVFREDSAEH